MFFGSRIFKIVRVTNCKKGNKMNSPVIVTPEKGEKKDVVNEISDLEEHSKVKIGLLEFIFLELPKLCTWGKLVNFVTTEILPVDMGHPPETSGNYTHKYFFCEMYSSEDPFEVKILVRVRLVAGPQTVVVYTDGYAVTWVPRHKLHSLDLKELEFTHVEHV